MRTAHPTLAILATLLLALLTPHGALAQGESPGDMRRENDELRNRVAQLEAQNKKLEQEATALRSQVAQAQAHAARAQRDLPKLRAEIDALHAQLRALGVEPESPTPTGAPGATPPGATPGSRPGQPADPGVAGLPNDPMACPPCLLEALRASYDQRFGTRSIDDNRADFVKDVRRWAGEMKREHRGIVSWTIEIQPDDIPGDEALPVRVRVVDPVSKEPYYAQPAAVDLGRRHTRRLMSEPDQRYWVIDGVFAADPQLNADRDDEGPIPFPPFIGPFAEFDFNLSVRGIAPAQ